MPLSDTPRALIATAIEPRLTRLQARNRDSQPDTPTTASSHDSVGSSDDELPGEAISSHGLLLDPFFGKSRLADRWLLSRLLPNSHEPYDASAFRSPGEQRPTTFRNVGYSFLLLLEAFPEAIRICAKGQRFKFTVRFMDYFADAVLPVVSVVTFAELFDLVQDALSGVEVTPSRIFKVAAPALLFKVLREVWDFWLLKLSVDVQAKIVTNVQEVYLKKQLYAKLSTLSDPYTKAVYHESEVMVGFAEMMALNGGRSASDPANRINSIMRAISSVLELLLSVIVMVYTIRKTVLLDPTAKSSMLFIAFAIAPLLLDALTRVVRMYEPESLSPGVSQELKAEADLVSSLGSNGPYKQEVLIHSLQDFVLSRWRTLRQRRLEQRHKAKRLEPVFTALACLHHAASIGFYAMIATYHSQLNVSLGSLRLYQSLNDRIANMVWATTYHCKRAYQNIFVLAAFVILSRMEDPNGVKSPAKAMTIDGEKPIRRGPVRIEARNLCFSYPGTTKPVLKDVNLTIEPGESVAIVGFNGGGKTTLIKVLMGLYQSTGTLLIDGQPAPSISSTELHARSACLFQDFSKYPLTLAENVGIGRNDLSLSALEDAIVKGGADGVLEKVGLDGRLNTTDVPDYEAASPISTLGEKPAEDDKEAQVALIRGSSLSGGQWQRVALARAFLKAATADLVVFDEPSSALDPKAEADLFDRIHSLAHGVDGHRATTIYVSHRFATVRSADKIAVVEDGTIIEFGPHDELMAKGGRYKELFEISARGFS